MAHEARLAEFDSVLQDDTINLSKLQQLCFTGIPDEGGRRAVCWCLLLHYLPLDRAVWNAYLTKKRAHYHSFVDDIIVRGSSLSNSNISCGNLTNNQNNRTFGSLRKSESISGSDAGSHFMDSTSDAKRRLSEEVCTNQLNKLSLSNDGIIKKNNSCTLTTSLIPNNLQNDLILTSSIDKNNSYDSITSNGGSSMPRHCLSSGNIPNAVTTMNVPSSSSANSVCSDHPLNLSPDSEWVTFFKDNEILGQIDKDVRRLCPDMCFFQRVTPHPRCHTPRLSSRVTHTPLHAAPLTARLSYGPRRAPSSTPPPSSLSSSSEAHWEVVERVLFIYAKLNPGQGYVQGMNEIIGPLYYVLATSQAFAEHAEADSFWLFTALMADVRDLFIRTLDDSESGIGRLMARLMVNLEQHDTATAIRLKDQGIREQYFAFRWLSLLFSQEFPLPDVIRVWDSVLSRTDTHAFLVHVATAMISLQRDALLAGDFACNMQLLQNYPPCDVGDILQKALQLARMERDSTSS